MNLKIGKMKIMKKMKKNNWFTKDKINKIASVHNYLDSLPEIGKVLSFSSIIDVATLLNNNKPDAVIVATPNQFQRKAYDKLFKCKNTCFIRKTNFR